MNTRLFSFNGFLLTIALILVFSCNQNLNDPNNLSLIPNLNVSLAEVRSVASNIYKSDKIKSIIGSKHSNIQNRTEAKKILNVISVPENGVTSYYIVNYADGGWVVISADKRVEPFLAFSEIGNIQKGDSIPSGLGVWLLNTHDKMQHLKKQGVSTYNIVCPVQVAWSQVSTQGVTPPSDCTGGGCQNQYSFTSVGPLTKTLWSQGCSFNNLTPTCNNPSYCNHTPTGCVATAMAQIMYYWKKPTTYNWASMNLNYAVQVLYADFGMELIVTQVLQINLKESLGTLMQILEDTISTH